MSCGNDAMRCEIGPDRPTAKSEDLKCFEFRIWSLFLLAGLIRALQCDAMCCG